MTDPKTLKDTLIEMSSEMWVATREPEERVKIIRCYHTAILELVKEAVPLPWSPDGSEPEKTVGWNACRTQTLKNLEGI